MTDIQSEYLQKKVYKFLNKNRILSLAVSSDDDIWASNCLFKFDETDFSLIITTDGNTRHAKIMKNSNDKNIVGTIYSPSPFLLLKKGLQYKGIVSSLSGQDFEVSKKLYLKKYPLFKNRLKEIWKIQLNEIKFIDMRMGLVKVSTWTR
ncbi:hypothetical protein A9G28_06600 [Gilliamella sp. Fer1-1]|jgi:uncharacterized protein|uniref:hypothetical protein n=1 Tax=Gilliamella sp. Fer1-1 TaxID=3120240 RepID=UPI00080EE2B3|nr:hypothetical protein [Gilliamella apicola]MCO6547215.1 hypothetical protein [Gilliamella sp.]OCG41178.1 hypothetical protein A9G28_06600 [Gilliamella apicola]